MTKPTQEQLDDVSRYWHGLKQPRAGFGAETIWWMATYANHRTAELRAKIERMQDIIDLREDEVEGSLIVMRSQAKRIAALEAELAAETQLSLGIIDGWKTECVRLEAELAARDFVPISEADWHEDIGPVLWWKFPIEEPPYSGSPLDTDWPGYHTHFTRIPLPQPPKEGE